MTEKSIRCWFRLFRAHLPHETPVLEHIVQLDEAFFKDRTLIMGTQRGTRKRAYDVVPGTAPQHHDAIHFLFRKVKPDTKRWTDGSGIYKNIDQCWPVEHQRDMHSRFEFEHTSEIEGVFGNYRTFVRRMYHHHRAENRC